MSKHQQTKTELMFTMGVVGRVLHMLSSDVITEMKTLFPNEDLEKNVQEAKIIFSHICASFQDKNKGYFRILEVRNCMRSLKRRAYEIEDILDKADPNHLEGKGIRARSTGLSSGLRNFTPSLIRKKAYRIDNILDLDKAATNHLEGKGIPERRSDLKSGVRFIISDLENICRLIMGKMSGKPSYIPPVLLSNASSHYDRLFPSLENEIIDRESEKKQLLDWIFHPVNHQQQQQQHPNLISVTGDSGIGKTSLAKLIFNDALVSASFDLLLWVSLKSTNYSTTTENLRNMIVEIIRSFTHQSWFYLQGMDMETLKYTLCDILAGQKYLLVLDHITYLRSGGWESLRELLKVGSMGSKVIFTATSSFGYWVHEIVSGANRLELKGLSEAGSWLLFSRCSKFDEEAEQEYYPSLSGIGRHIIKKCRGNPGAIKTLGNMLRTNRDENMWKQINEIMFSFCLQSMSLQLVQCFSVYAIISKYTALSRDQLVYFWMAQGLLYSTEANDADLPDIGHRYCNELLSRSFIHSYQSDDHSRLFVNDAFQQLLTSIKDEEIQLSV